MSLPTRPHPANVPTLTEVIELNPESGAMVPAASLVMASPLLAPDVAFVPEPAPEPVHMPAPAVPALLPASSSSMVPLASIPDVNPVAPLEAIEPEVSEAQLSHRVLTDVQRQIDSMLEFRLRESMQPLLAQFTETLMQDLRDELSRTMRDVVTRAVAQEVAKLRNNR
ncbi:MAG: hypothetical protein EOP36_05135 [Rubrivivax sp.]|nr:MAG: hypothetical protein EOP36_05135 [Rubrivivax sp.]